MRVDRLMSRPAHTILTGQSIGKAAGLMRRFGVGVLPVVNPQGTVVGMLTDRDLVVGLAWQQDGPLATLVESLMTTKVVHCYADQTVAAIAAIMGDHQVRRLPVLDRAERLVGIVSVGDIAEDASERLAGEALGEIVETR